VLGLFTNIFVLRKRKSKTTNFNKQIPDFFIWMSVIHNLFMPLKHDLYTSSTYPRKRGSPWKTNKKYSSIFMRITKLENDQKPIQENWHIVLLDYV
jgi:hypothetical protein